MGKKRLQAANLFMLEDKEPADKPSAGEAKERELTANDLVGRRHRKKKPKSRLKFS
jgi:hypothetical protein